MDISILPDGIFRTLLSLWSVVRDTYVRVYEWMGSTAFGDSGSVLSFLFGSGIFVIMTSSIWKWIKGHII